MTPRRQRTCPTLLVALVLAASAAHAQSVPAQAVLIENVRIFNGTSDRLSPPSNVLVVGNRIERISAGPIPANDPSRTTTVIAGGGRTLMPGMIDAHAHLMFATVPQLVLLTSDITYSASLASG